MKVLGSNLAPSTLDELFQDDLGIEEEGWSRGYIRGYFKEVKAVK
jgi:hypothetical protein